MLSEKDLQAEMGQKEAPKVRIANLGVAMKLVEGQDQPRLGVIGKSLQKVLVIGRMRQRGKKARMISEWNQDLREMTISPDLSGLYAVQQE